MIPVMLGVYLGFLVSDWAENNRKRERHELLKANVLAEIKINQEHLEKIVTYHEIVRDSSMYYSDPQVPMRKPAFFKGTRITKLTNSAYMTGIQTGSINEFPIGDLQRLNQVYTLQKDYNDYGNLILSNLISLDFSSDEQDLKRIARFLSITMIDAVGLEKELIHRYDEIQKNLKD